MQLAKPNMTELGNGFAGLHIEALAQASCSKAGEICTSVGGLILDMQIRRSGASEVSANFRTCSSFLPRQAGRIENDDISEGVAWKQHEKNGMRNSSIHEGNVELEVIEEDWVIGEARRCA